MPHDDAFLQAIIENPDDDAPVSSMPTGSMSVATVTAPSSSGFSATWRAWTLAEVLRPLIWSDFVSHKDYHSILGWNSTLPLLGKTSLAEGVQRE